MGHIFHLEWKLTANEFNFRVFKTKTIFIKKDGEKFKFEKKIAPIPTPKPSFGQKLPHNSKYNQREF